MPVQNDGFKTCSRCRLHQPVAMFYKSVSNADGYAYQCKTCESEQKRRRRHTPEGKQLERIHHRAYAERHRAEIKERDRQDKRWRTYKRPPSPKVKARAALRNAVQRGKITKATHCEQCGIKTNTHGHHNDYSQPFNVEWLCSICHGKKHRLEPWERLRAEGRS